MPSARSQAIDRSERKLRTGVRDASGSCPIWITQASARGRWTCGDQGASASRTRIASARARSGAGSSGAAIGCAVGTASASAQYWQTGIPQSSASAASAAKPSALPAPCWAKITGCSASARMRAASAISAAPGRATAGAISGGASRPSADAVSQRTSRGRLT